MTHRRQRQNSTQAHTYSTAGRYSCTDCRIKGCLYYNSNNILLYWSECNLPAAAGTTSRAIAPPIPSAPSSAIHMRWVGEGMHCQGGQVKQGGRIQTPKGVVRRKGEERLLNLAFIIWNTSSAGSLQLFTDP